MLEVYAYAKLVLNTEQSAWVIKQYYSTRSVKCKPNAFTVEFSEMNVPMKNTILDLIKEFEIYHTLNNLQHAGKPSARTPTKKREIAEQVKFRHSTSSRKIAH